MYIVTPPPPPTHIYPLSHHWHLYQIRFRALLSWEGVIVRIDCGTSKVAGHHETMTPLGISAIHSTRNLPITTAHMQISSSLSITKGMNESDSNADTCCLGKFWIVYNYTSHTADVYPYDQACKPSKDVPIVIGASAYTDPNSTTFILIIHKALFYGSNINHSLSNPNQLRFNNVNYWDNP